jgi:phytoene/squalene synthetase
MSRIGSGSDKADSVNPPDHVPGFWLHLIEVEARAIATGQLPEAVREAVATMMDNYDAHLRAAERQLEQSKPRQSA